MRLSLTSVGSPGAGPKKRESDAIIRPQASRERSFAVELKHRPKAKAMSGCGAAPAGGRERATYLPPRGGYMVGSCPAAGDPMDARTLYDDDIVTWSEQQAAALRELAAKPELSNAVDWENLIEEVETLGRSEWGGVASQIRNALVHVLKGFCDPNSPARWAWSIETGAFLDQARDDYRPSMREKIDLDALWRKAFRSASRELLTYRRRVPPGIPEGCPFSLDEILAKSFDYESAVRRLYELLDARH